MNIGDVQIVIPSGTNTISPIDYNSLHDYDKMRVMLEQAIFAHYLVVTTQSRTYEQYLSYLGMERTTLKRDLFTDNTALAGLYRAGLEALTELVNGKDNQHRMSSASFEMLQSIFAEQGTMHSGYPYYTGSMTNAFLTLYCVCCQGIYPTEAEADVRPAAIFLPNESIKSRMVADGSKKSKVSFIRNDFQEVAVDSFSLDMFKTTSTTSPLLSYIGACDMKNFNIEDIVGILASFSLDHARISNEYAIANLSSTGETRVADVCFDLVTGSTFTARAAGARPVDMNQFVAVIKEMTTSGRLQPVEDYVLFGELLSKTGETSTTVNYFTKPESLVSAEEARSFRQSEYITFIRDRFSPGLAAIDAEAEDEEEPADDMTNDTTAEDAPDDVTDDAAPEEDLGTDDAADAGDADAMAETDVPDDTADQGQKNPTLDPNMMLLELVQPSETMSDYIYREMVGRRIASILRNPPQNARPNDLLMLKRWKSRWLYLASIACLRDFLARVSLRLTDTK